MINRTIEKTVRKEIQEGRKAVVLLGARQVGKTTLLRNILNGVENVLWLNGDASNDRALLTDRKICHKTYTK